MHCGLCWSEGRWMHSGLRTRERGSSLSVWLSLARGHTLVGALTAPSTLLDLTLFGFTGLGRLSGSSTGVTVKGAQD